MLITLLYHHAPSDLESFKKELMLLVEKHPFVLPGDKIPLSLLSFCLTFDDAFFDFYYFIYPILKELKIKALLAVPAKLIKESCTLPPKKRLNRTNYLHGDNLCSFEELKEMLENKSIAIASHSYTHSNLCKGVNLDEEIILSKETLQQKLCSEISTFVYPFGSFNKKVHKLVKKHYQFAMRIGGTFNFSWQNTSEITYRIVADGKSISQLLTPLCYTEYLGKYLVNSIRFR